MIKTYFVDAFTTEKFKGNPAAVCIVDGESDESIMQGIATEIGFSETAFVRALSGARYSIRFFTPKKEILLCGHATLAAAKIFFETTEAERASFINIEGIELITEKAGNKIRMQFPVYETQKTEVPLAMLAALGIEKIIAARYSSRNNIVVIEIENTQVLRSLAPDFTALLASYTGINGVLVTARGEDGYDFHYRYFWPWAGTNEDPVTGGVQTFLTKYWAEKLNKFKLKAFQSSQRTGMMETELTGNSVFIYGEAVVLFEGIFKT